MLLRLKKPKFKISYCLVDTTESNIYLFEGREMIEKRILSQAIWEEIGETSRIEMYGNRQWSVTNNRPWWHAWLPRGPGTTVQYFAVRLGSRTWQTRASVCQWSLTGSTARSITAIVALCPGIFTNDSLVSRRGVKKEIEWDLQGPRVEGTFGIPELWYWGSRLELYIHLGSTALLVIHPAGLFRPDTLLPGYITPRINKIEVQDSK